MDLLHKTNSGWNTCYKCWSTMYLRSWSCCGFQAQADTGGRVCRILYNKSVQQMAEDWHFRAWRAKDFCLHPFQICTKGCKRDAKRMQIMQMSNAFWMSTSYLELHRAESLPRYATTATPWAWFQRQPQHSTWRFVWSSWTCVSSHQAGTSGKRDTPLHFGSLLCV